jgi:large subunit ribosomal protein L25
MEVVKLEVELRPGTGKGPARRLRRAGKLPAVLYGHGDSEAVTITPEALIHIRQSEAGENAILELAIAGRPQTCYAILREVQIDPVSRAPIHADLYRVMMDEPIRVTVPLEFVNVPEDRLKLAQATLSPLLHTVEVECLPRDIPEVITVDLAALEIGKVLHAEALVLPQGVTLLTDPEQPVVTTEAIREAEEAEAPAGEVAASETAEGERPSATSV